MAKLASPSALTISARELGSATETMLLLGALKLALHRLARETHCASAALMGSPGIKPGTETSNPKASALAPTAVIFGIVSLPVTKVEIDAN